MRRIAFLIPLALLAACEKEPDFETRFDKASGEIEARAKAMDADIATADKAAKDADEAEPGARIQSPEKAP